MMYRVCMIAEVGLLSQRYWFCFGFLKYHTLIYIFLLLNCSKNMQRTLSNYSIVVVLQCKINILIKKKKHLMRKNTATICFPNSLSVGGTDLSENLMLLMSHLGVNKAKDNTSAQHHSFSVWSPLIIETTDAFPSVLIIILPGSRCSLLFSFEIVHLFITLCLSVVDIFLQRGNSILPGIIIS